MINRSPGKVDTGGISAVESAGLSCFKAKVNFHVCHPPDGTGPVGKPPALSTNKMNRDSNNE